MSHFKGWHRILQDHPDAARPPKPEFEETLRGLTYQNYTADHNRAEVAALYQAKFGHAPQFVLWVRPGEWAAGPVIGVTP